MGALLFYKEYYIVGDSLKDSVVNMVAAVLGMIPEGLVLLTSVALTLGSLVLGKQTLVQELYCIETLARVDTLCLDKTGTITEGTMCVDSVKLYKTEEDSERIAEETEAAENTGSTEQISEEDQAALKNVDYVMGNLMNVLTDQNATADALAAQRFPVRKDMKPVHAIPFSSDRKYSGAVFEGQGTYLMGAVQFLFPGGK